MENENNKKKTAMKIIITVLLLVVLIALILYTYNRVSTNQTTDIIDTANTENIVSTNEENNILVAEATEEVEKTWEWQHNTLENQNINRSAIENVHTSLDSYPISMKSLMKLKLMHMQI